MSVSVVIRGPAKKVEAAKAHQLEIVSWGRDIQGQFYSLRMLRSDGLSYEIKVSDETLRHLFGPVPWAASEKELPDEPQRRQEELEEMFSDVGPRVVKDLDAPGADFGRVENDEDEDL